MTEYIPLCDAVCIADYAVDEHPYDKDPEKPETFSMYNRGWHDACDHIRYSLEELPTADVAPVRHGRWIRLDVCKGMENFKCSACRSESYVPTCMHEPMSAYCPNCGAKMDGGDDNS